MPPLSHRPPIISLYAEASKVARPPAPRSGRLLVECLVAMLLLGIAGTALSAGTRALASVADDALLVSRAQAAAVSSAELALADCDSATTPGTTTAARVTVSRSDTRPTRLRARTVSVLLSLSPLAQRTSQRLSLSTARLCR